MASPKCAVDIRDYLANTTGLSPVSVGYLEPSVVNQYAVVEYPGPTNIKTHGGGAPQLEYARLQILARHKTAQTALTNIMTIVDALDGLKDVTINGTVYTYMTQVSRPRIIERDESGLVLYAWEVEVQARR